MDNPNSTPHSQPFLWGCKAIAAFIGKSPRATFHMLERGDLPARKCGGQWVADRDVLLNFLRGVPSGTAD
jgi:hypothetical protein